ncbi:hypothetical protein [Nonomuraea typhae]|uniref:Uncharacterized protein n=1 Tax=Nonomuraea typhae TaxID=2603600 RepID=A0ABW7YNC7_9ACTN
MVERAFAVVGYIAAAVALIWWVLSRIQSWRLWRARRRPLPPMDPAVRELELARAGLPNLLADERRDLFEEIRDMERGGKS